MKNSTKAILALLIVVGAILRVYQISFACLWTEEQFTLAMAKLPMLDILTTFDFTPFPYYILAHISYLIFGTDVSIRYPAVIFGILLIPAIYLLGRTYKDELVGLYCAAFTTILIPFVYYSQYARSYTMSVFFFALLLIFYIKTKRGEKSEVWFWFLAAANLWIHLFIAIPVAMLCLDLIIDRYQRAFYAVLIFIVSLPLINIIYQTIAQRSVSGGINYGASWIQMLILTPTELFNVLFLNISVLAGVSLKLDKDPLKWKLFTVALLTFLVGIVCANFTPTMPRYIMGITVIILLMASVGIVELSELVKVKYFKIFVFVAIMLISVWMSIPNLESHYLVEQYVC